MFCEIPAEILAEMFGGINRFFNSLAKANEPSPT